MEVNEKTGGCIFWVFMAVMFVIAIATFPVGIVILIIQAYMIRKVLEAHA